MPHLLFEKFRQETIQYNFTEVSNKVLNPQFGNFIYLAKRIFTTLRSSLSLLIVCDQMQTNKYDKVGCLKLTIVIY